MTLPGGAPAEPHFLVTNDDSISAPGIAALAAVARQLGRVSIVAPVAPCSCTSHQTTTSHPLKVNARAPDELAVEGWPVDCVRLALRALDLPPIAWVLSGINAGGNLGADVYISGTVAAVREAALLGKPGIAFSHYKKRDLDYDWDRAARLVLPLLRELMQRGCPPGAFWNVNLPHVAPDALDPGVVDCDLDPHPLPVSYRQQREGVFLYEGDYHSRPRDPGRDVAVCMGDGQIAVSLLRL